jgi:hypothetical protein
MPTLLERIRTKPPAAAPAPSLFDGSAARAPAHAPPPAAPAALELLASLEGALAHAPRLDAAARAGRRGAHGHGYTVSAVAASGRVVHVAPSRCKDGLFLLVADGMDTESHEGIMALRSRLARGGLDPDAAIWRVELADWHAAAPTAGV